MAKLTYGQLEQTWIQAGGNRGLAPLMAAIALAESSGDPEATNPTDNNGTQTSWGLWQISDGTHNMPSADILTPLGNARAAVAKYRTQGLSAWGTYDSGAYKVFYRGSVPPSQLPQGGGGVQSATDTSIWNTLGLGPVAGIVQGIFGTRQAVNDFTHGIEWFLNPGNIARIIAFIFGTQLAFIGIIALIKTGGEGQYGDVSLAIGILLVTLAGICFFIAFHNVPTDISSIGELFGWLSASVREGKPAGGPVKTASKTV